MKHGVSKEDIEYINKISEQINSSKKPIEVINEFTTILDKSEIIESLTNLQERDLIDTFIKGLAGNSSHFPKMPISEAIELYHQVFLNAGYRAYDGDIRKLYQSREEELPLSYEIKLYLIAFQNIFGSSIQLDQIFKITFMLLNYVPKHLKIRRK